MRFASYRTLALVVLLCHALGAGARAQGGGRVGGVVRDAAGAAVRGAEVSLKAGRVFSRRAVTDDEGRFLFEGVSGSEGTLSVRAEGFAGEERRWRAGEEVVFILAPAPFAEGVTVTATRTGVSTTETAGSLSVVTSETLSRSAALTLDDALRQVPGFQLFRRTGARAANPTAQGVSLRGVGASGASRALVLADGVPLNDPFGGWVYWGRVPAESVERVEVVRGGASHLYGSGALGGAVQILTRRIEEAPRLSLEAAYGSQQTHDASLFASGRKGRWGASLAAESFRTGGYFLVRPEDRGGADARAASRWSALTLTVERELTETLRLFARGSHFGEARQNGTRQQFNRTHARQLTAGLDWQHERAGAFTLRAYASTQVLDQSFTALSADRGRETLTRLQRVPSQAAGLSAQWSRAAGRRHALAAGLEAREVRGASDELVYVAGRPASLVGAGGRERTLGLFAEDLFRLTPRLLLSAGARLDRWRNFGALEASRPVAGGRPANAVVFPDRSESAFSPRASILYRPHDAASVYASAYRAFRAPTLNELYRDFRVGDALTLADENLRAERLTGGEVGASLATPGGRLAARGGLFWLELARAVGNVTLSVAPGLITRQRRNLGRTRSRGFELEMEARLSARWSLSGGYQFTDARVVSFPSNVALEGRRIPQTPRQQFTFNLQYTNPRRLSFGLQGRAAGPQFDDDLNLFRLGPLFALDALASRRLHERLEAFLAAENLTGRRYEVGRTPVLTLGPPRTLRLGLRLRLGSR